MHTFDTPGSVSLQIKLSSGRVLVTTVDEPSTTVEVVARGRRGQDAIDDIEITMDDRAGRQLVGSSRRTSSAGVRSRSRGAASSSAASRAPPERTSSSPAGRRTCGSRASSATCPCARRRATSGSSPSRRSSSQDGQWRRVPGSSRREGSVVTVSGDVDVERVDAALTTRSVSGDVTIGASTASSASRRRPATST